MGLEVGKTGRPKAQGEEDLRGPAAGQDLEDLAGVFGEGHGLMLSKGKARGYTGDVKEVKPDWKDFWALVLALYSLLLPPLLLLFGVLFAFLLLLRLFL